MVPASEMGEFAAAAFAFVVPVVAYVVVFVAVAFAEPAWMFVAALAAHAGARVVAPAFAGSA